MILQFVKVCALSDIGEGQVKTFSANNHELAIAKYNGQVYALDNVCTHDEGALGEGDIIEGQLQCPRHGARFDLKTGEVTRMPAAVGIETYEVKIENGEIFVALWD